MVGEQGREGIWEPGEGMARCQSQGPVKEERRPGECERGEHCYDSGFKQECFFGK